VGARELASAARDVFTHWNQATTEKKLPRRSCSSGRAPASSSKRPPSPATSTRSVSARHQASRRRRGRSAAGNPASAPDPGPAVLLEDGQFLDRRRLVVGNGVHADVSERRAGRPLHLTQRREIVAARQPNHNDYYSRNGR